MPDCLRNVIALCEEPQIRPCEYPEEGEIEKPSPICILTHPRDTVGREYFDPRIEYWEVDLNVPEVVCRTNQLVQLVLEEGEVPTLARFLHDESVKQHALSARVNSNRGRAFIIKMISYLDIKSLIEGVPRVHGA